MRFIGSGFRLELRGICFSSALSTPPQRSWGLLLHRRDNCLQINHKK
jgi:hypothetical protein